MDAGHAFSIVSFSFLSVIDDRGDETRNNNIEPVLFIYVSAKA